MKHWSDKSIPGLNGNSSTDLPVLLPHVPTQINDHIGFSRWLATFPPYSILILAALVIFWPSLGFAANGFTFTEAMAVLVKWLPFIVGSGFVFNVIISVFTMLIGTIAGVVLGLAQISPTGAIRLPAQIITQVFRNSPWLVLLFIVLLALPFEITIGSLTIPVPDWAKAVFGLSLPIMANISEVVRGGVNSVPSGQWEAAESLAYTRHQTLWKVILPQCFKRMIPPWMNWYAILTMATPLCSLLGVEELITLSRQAIEAENNLPELLVPFYGFALLIFFAYCYPIARFTVRLEGKFHVKL